MGIPNCEPDPGDPVLDGIRGIEFVQPEWTYSHPCVGNTQHNTHGNNQVTCCLTQQTILFR